MNLGKGFDPNLFVQSTTPSTTNEEISEENDNLFSINSNGKSGEKVIDLGMDHRIALDPFKSSSLEKLVTIE
jgi:MFS family permease